MPTQQAQRGVTLRHYLLLNIAGIVVLLSSTVILATWFGSQRTVRMVAAAITAEKLERTLAEAHGFLDPVSRHLIEVAEWSRSELLDISTPESAEALFAPIFREYPQISAARIADATGHELALVHDEGIWLLDLTDSAGGAVQRTVITTTSRRSEELDTDYDPRDTLWYQQAELRLAAGSETPAMQRIYHSKPYTLRTLERPGFTSSLAFRNDAEVHVVAFDLLCYDVNMFTASIGQDGDALAFAITRHGTVLGLPRSAVPLGVEETEQRLLKRVDDLGDPLISDAMSALAGAIDTGEPVEFVSGDTVWWGEARTLPVVTDFGDPDDHGGAIVAVVVPEHRLLRGLWVQLSWIIVILVIASGVVMWWTFRVAARIGRPIETLVMRGTQLSRGMPRDDTPTDSFIREVNTFSEVLDDMQDSLGMLFRAERSLQRARIEEVAEVRVSGFDLASWGESAASRAGSRVQQAVPHHTTATWDQIGCPDDSAVLMLADATGDGLESEFLASQVHSMVRMAAGLNPDVLAATRAVNDQLYSDMTQGRFVSAWLGKISGTNGVLSSCAAGLEPQFHYVAADGDCRLLRSESMPLGVFDDTSAMSTEAITLARGDVFVIVSDRVFSFHDAGGQLLAPERLAESLRRRAGDPAAAILAGLREDILSFVGDHPRTFGCALIVVKKT